MSLEKRTVLDRIEIQADGRIFFRLLKQIVDGDTVIHSEPHRSVVEPGTPVAVQVAAVNEHLTQLGFPAMTDADLKQLEEHAAIAAN